MAYHPDANNEDRFTRQPYGPPVSDPCPHPSSIALAHLICRPCASRPLRALGCEQDYLSAFFYLTDVTPHTPAFSVVPKSTLCRTLTEVREQQGDDYVSRAILCCELWGHAV